MATQLEAAGPGGDKAQPFYTHWLRPAACDRA
jgi:hypothetical protein